MDKDNKSKSASKNPAKERSRKNVTPTADKCPRMWEKARRDRLKVLFDELSRLLPKYDPAEPPARPKIIHKAIEFIRELQAQNEDLLKGGFDEAYKSKLDAWKDRVKVLVNRVEQLSDVLRKANIHVPPLALNVLPVPGWANARPKHWSNKINLPDHQLRLVMDSLSTKTKKAKDTARRKRKMIDPQHKENNPNVIGEPKKSKLMKKSQEITSPVSISETLSKCPESAIDKAQPSPAIILPQSNLTTSTNSFINTNPQPGTFILTNQGNLLPVLTSVIINRPPVLLMPTPIQQHLPAVAAKTPPNKRRIDRESTVMTFANKKPIPALSRQSHTRKGGKCVAHKTRNGGSTNLMPAICSNVPAVSPTTTFLSSFPVVSTPKLNDSQPEVKPSSTFVDAARCSTSPPLDPTVAKNSCASKCDVKEQMETEVVFTIDVSRNDLETQKDGLNTEIRSGPSTEGFLSNPAVTMTNKSPNAISKSTMTPTVDPKNSTDIENSKHSQNEQLCSSISSANVSLVNSQASALLSSSVKDINNKEPESYATNLSDNPCTSIGQISVATSHNLETASKTLPNLKKGEQSSICEKIPSSLSIDTAPNIISKNDVLLNNSIKSSTGGIDNNLVNTSSLFESGNTSSKPQSSLCNLSSTSQSFLSTPSGSVILTVESLSTIPATNETNTSDFSSSSLPTDISDSNRKHSQSELILPPCIASEPVPKSSSALTCRTTTAKISTISTSCGLMDTDQSLISVSCSAANNAHNAIENVPTANSSLTITSSSNLTQKNSYSSDLPASHHRSLVPTTVTTNESVFCKIPEPPSSDCSATAGLDYTTTSSSTTISEPTIPSSSITVLPGNLPINSQISSSSSSSRMSNSRQHSSWLSSSLDTTATSTGALFNPRTPTLAYTLPTDTKTSLDYRAGRGKLANEQCLPNSVSMTFPNIESLSGSARSVAPSISWPTAMNCPSSSSSVPPAYQQTTLSHSISWPTTMQSSSYAVPFAGHDWPIIPHQCERSTLGLSVTQAPVISNTLTWPTNVQNSASSTLMPSSNHAPIMSNAHTWLTTVSSALIPSASRAPIISNALTCITTVQNCVRSTSILSSSQAPTIITSVQNISSQTSIPSENQAPAVSHTITWPTLVQNIPSSTSTSQAPIIPNPSSLATKVHNISSTSIAYGGQVPIISNSLTWPTTVQNSTSSISIPSARQAPIISNNLSRPTKVQNSTSSTSILSASQAQITSNASFATAASNTSSTSIPFQGPVISKAISWPTTVQNTTSSSLILSASQVPTVSNAPIVSNVWPTTVHNITGPISIQSGAQALTCPSTVQSTLNSAITSFVSQAPIIPNALTWQTTVQDIMSTSSSSQAVGNTALITSTSITWSSALPIMSPASIASNKSQSSWLQLSSIYSSPATTTWRCTDPAWSSSQADPWAVHHNNFAPNVTSVQFSNASTFVNSSFVTQHFNESWTGGAQNYTYLGDTYATKSEAYVPMPNFSVNLADSSCVSSTRTIISEKSGAHSSKRAAAYRPNSSLTFTNLTTISGTDAVSRSESFYVPPLSEPWCAPASTSNKVTATSYRSSLATSSFLTSKANISSDMTLTNSKIDEPWKTPTFVQSNENWPLTSQSVPVYSSAPYLNSCPTTTFAETSKNINASLPQNISKLTSVPRLSSGLASVKCAGSEPEHFRPNYVQSSIHLPSQPWRDSPHVKTNSTPVAGPFLSPAIPSLSKTELPVAPPDLPYEQSALNARKADSTIGKPANTKSLQTFASDAWSNRPPDPFAGLPHYSQQGLILNNVTKQPGQQYEPLDSYMSSIVGTNNLKPYVDPKTNHERPSKNIIGSDAAANTTQTFVTASVTHSASVNSIYLSTVSKSDTKNCNSVTEETPKNNCHDLYQNTFMAGNLQFAPPAGQQSLSPEIAAATPVLSKTPKKEKKDLSTPKIKEPEKLRNTGKNETSEKICDSSSLWSSQYFSQIPGSEAPWVDFTYVDPKESRPKPPVNWMTESEQLRSDSTQYDDSYQRYVFDRKEPTIFDFLSNPVDQEANKSKKKDELMTQDYFGWMSMKVDGLVPSTLPTLVGDLALSNDATPTKRPKVNEYQPISAEKHKITHEYQPTATEKHKVSNDYRPVAHNKPEVLEPFTNLSKNIFELSESTKDADTIVLKNIFELPTAQPTKQKANVGPNSFLSVSQLVESDSGHQEVVQKTDNFTYYNHELEKSQHTDWKKCEHKSRSSYSAEALLRPEGISTSTSYTEYSNVAVKPPVPPRQRKQDYFRGQELKPPPKSRPKKQEMFPNLGQSVARLSAPYGNMAFPYSDAPLGNTYSPNVPARLVKPADGLYAYSKAPASTPIQNRQQKPGESVIAMQPPYAQNRPRHKQPTPSTSYPLALGYTGNCRQQHLPMGPPPPPPWPPLPAQSHAPSGSSLANFNLTTIFPEMNKKGYQYT